MNENFVINIGRQLGSGGHQIGKQLAGELDVPFYDKELIQIASQESGLEKTFFEQADEKSKHSLLGGIFNLRSSLVDEIYVNNYLSNETLFKIQSDVIRKLAEQGSGVFVGRCADYILKDHPLMLSVFICADMGDRIKRIAENQQLSESKAKELIEKIDKKRAGYYEYYSNKVWGAAGSYHLCVNSSVLGIDETVQFIRKFAEQKLNLK
ncbi:MAG: cytidylate kinase-like family protein [Paludibacter sp.]|nr:cytidylate kinase-like family protein [Paludibacter sp.]